MPILPPNLPFLRSTKDTKFKSDKLSQNYFELREKCLRLGNLFEDPEFPKGKSASYLGWKRPTEFMKNPKFFVDGVSRFDVKQGHLGDCWFLSTLASLTLHPELINRVVPSGQSFDENYAGIFHFQFWYYGKWVDVVVDDRLPVQDDSLAMNQSSERNEFWSALLEKAFAKLYGSYEALDGGYMDEAMETLTGGITDRYDLKKLTPNLKLFQIFKKIFNEKSPTIIACGIVDENQEATKRGLIDGHAYSITDATTVVTLKNTAVDLVRVRNPWGNKAEWNGPWSDSSPDEWDSVTDEAKCRINLLEKEDGEFWMAYNDFWKYFDIVQICDYLSPVDSKWKEIDLEGKWEGETAGGNRHHPTYSKNPRFKLKFTTAHNQRKKLIIALMQKNTREEKKECVGIGFYVSKFSEHNGKICISNKSSEQFLGYREECDRFDLESGMYSIVVCTKYPNQKAEFLIRILSERGSTVEIYKRGEKSFEKFCDSDGEMNSSQLQELLKHKQRKNKLLSVNPDVEFSERLCRVLLNAFDTNCSGRLDRNEFICMWSDILEWKDAFEKSRIRSTQLELSPDELRSALNSMGVPLLEPDFQKLVAENKKIGFAASLTYAFHLQMHDVVPRKVR